LAQEWISGIHWARIGSRFLKSKVRSRSRVQFYMYTLYSRYSVKSSRVPIWLYFYV
jgi:hypothetical protein